MVELRRRLNGAETCSAAAGCLLTLLQPKQEATKRSDEKRESKSSAARAVSDGELRLRRCSSEGIRR